MRPYHGKACPAVEDSLGKGDEMGGRGKLRDGLKDLLSGSRSQVLRR